MTVKKYNQLLNKNGNRWKGVAKIAMFIPSCFQACEIKGSENNNKK